MISSPRPRAREAEVVVEDRSVVEEEEEVEEVAVPDVEEDSEAAVEAQVVTVTPAVTLRVSGTMTCTEPALEVVEV